MLDTLTLEESSVERTKPVVTKDWIKLHPEQRDTNGEGHDDDLPDENDDEGEDFDETQDKDVRQEETEG